MLPLTGEVVLSISRPKNTGVPRSMDLLENSLRTIEEFMGQPIPLPQRGFVKLRFVQPIPGLAGFNRWRGFLIAIEIDHRFDVDNDSWESAHTGNIIAHELAHYYFRGNKRWLNEGGAEFLEAFSENRRRGRLIEADRLPCTTFANIRDLEARNPGPDDPYFSCNYSLGQRLFFDLFRNMEEGEFREAFRALYQNTISGDGGIDEVRSAFPSDTSQRIINR